MQERKFKKIEVYCDGLCEPNPKGIATYGYTIFQDGKEIKCGCDWLGEGDGMTNNVAEYTAVIEALSWLKEQDLDKATKVIVKSDSQLLINQLKGNWRVLSERLSPLFKKAKYLSSLFNIEYRWIPREKNKKADMLSRVAYGCYLKEKEKNSSRAIR